MIIPTAITNTATTAISTAMTRTMPAKGSPEARLEY